jgi:glycosyltransferase involved in cell wall biosynthesis
MFKCFKHQDYKGPVEWIIVDDGTDKIEDLIISSGIPNIKYYKLNEKITLGKKRNLMHKYAKGDIIIYMDDDDYYPPERISHAVEALQNHPSILCAGSTIMYTYFKDIDKIIQFGPYGPNHATAATFAFKKKLLTITSYNEEEAMGEEKHFLKNYTIPIIQLDPVKVILVISHKHNTFDKRILLQQQNNPTVSYTTLLLENFIKNQELYQFYKNNVHHELIPYTQGESIMKPDVINHINKKQQKQQQQQQQNMTVKFGDKLLQGNEIIQQLNQQQQYIKILTNKIIKLEQELNTLNRRHN